MACSFTIQPPTTTGDDGQPSNSLVEDARRVLALMEDERVLTAHALLAAIKERMHETKSTTKRLKKMASFRKEASSGEEDYRAASAILESNQAKLDKLNVRVIYVYCVYMFFLLLWILSCSLLPSHSLLNSFITHSFIHSCL